MDRSLQVRLRATAFSFLLITGCAVNDHLMVKVCRFENTTTRVVTLESWGFHLFTNPGDAGLAIGHSRRVYYFPRHPDAPVPAGQAVAAVSHQNDPAAPERLRRVGDCDKGLPLGFPHLARLGRPFALQRKTTGLLAQANRSEVGLSAGESSAYLLSVPSTFQGIISVDAVGFDPSESNPFFSEVQP